MGKPKEPKNRKMDGKRDIWKAQVLGPCLVLDPKHAGTGSPHILLQFYLETIGSCELVIGNRTQNKHSGIWNTRSVCWRSWDFLHLSVQTSGLATHLLLWFSYSLGDNKRMGPIKSQYHPHTIGVHCHCSSRDAFGLILLNSSNFLNKTSLYKSSQMRKNCKSPLLLRIILLETDSPK